MSESARISLLPGPARHTRERRLQKKFGLFSKFTFIMDGASPFPPASSLLPFPSFLSLISLVFSVFRAPLFLVPKVYRLWVGVPQILGPLSIHPQMTRPLAAPVYYSSPTKRIKSNQDRIINWIKQWNGKLELKNNIAERRCMWWWFVFPLPFSPISHSLFSQGTKAESCICDDIPRWLTFQIQLFIWFHFNLFRVW